MPSGAPLLHPKCHSCGPTQLDAFAGLGVRLVVVVGCRQQVNELLEEQGVHAQHACGYRVTDAVAMQAVVQAAGSSRMEVEARLSKVRSGVHRGVQRSCRQSGQRCRGLAAAAWRSKPTLPKWESCAVKWSRLGLRMGQSSPSTRFSRQRCIMPALLLAKPQTR